MQIRKSRFLFGFFLGCGDGLHKARVIMTTYCCQRAYDSCLQVTPQVVHSFVTTELHSKQSSTKEPAIEGDDVSVFPPYAFCCWIFSAIHPSIHPSIFFRLSGAGSRGQLSEQGRPDFPLPGRFLQLLRRIPRRSQDTLE